MTVLERVTAAIVLGAALVGTPPAFAQSQPQSPQPSLQNNEPKQLEEFVPIDRLPQEEQIPAASLLIPAYAFVWVAVLLYVISLAKRLGTVQREVERLESDVKGKRA